MIKVTLLAIMLIALVPPASTACDLQTETLKAWAEYIRNADLRMQARLDGHSPFLWIDESPDRRQRTGQGEIVVAPAIAQGMNHVPSGLIHHWIGGIFIPHSTIQSVSAVTHDYSRYKDFYKPVVVDSRLISCDASEQKFSMVWQTKVLVTTAAMTGEYQVRDFRVDEHHGYSISDTIKVREIENYGKPGEQILPAGTGNGFIWRLHGISRYEERNGGVYLEREAIALTRDIPFSLRWFVSSIINRLSTSSLTTSMQQTRDAVASSLASAQAFTACGNRFGN
jgi:hypothetical protein